MNMSIPQIRAGVQSVPNVELAGVLRCNLAGSTSNHGVCFKHMDAKAIERLRYFLKDNIRQEEFTVYVAPVGKKHP